MILDPHRVEQRRHHVDVPDLVIDPESGRERTTGEGEGHAPEGVVEV